MKTYIRVAYTNPPQLDKHDWRIADHPVRPAREYEPEAWWEQVEGPQIAAYIQLGFIVRSFDPHQLEPFDNASTCACVITGHLSETSSRRRRRKENRMEPG